jgi:hypothetical protein
LHYIVIVMNFNRIKILILSFLLFSCSGQKKKPEIGHYNPSPEEKELYECHRSNFEFIHVKEICVKEEIVEDFCMGRPVPYFKEDKIDGFEVEWTRMLCD